MSLIATLEALVAAGATAEMLLAVVRTHEAAREDALTKRRAADAARQSTLRDRKKSRDITLPVSGSRDTSPHVGAGAPVVTPSLPSLRSEEVVGGVGGGTREADDWPDGKASDHAERLIADIASPWLDPSKSPDLVTTRGRLAAWRRDGASWEHDVVAVVTALCANRRSKVGSWKFFDQAVARSIAENRAALEIPAASQLRQTGPPTSLTDRIAAENAEARRRAFEMLDAQDGPKN